MLAGGSQGSAGVAHRARALHTRCADFTAGFDDVYWVTMSQLIEWMKDPKPASQMAKGGQPMQALGSPARRAGAAA